MACRLVLALGIAVLVCSCGGGGGGDVVPAAPAAPVVAVPPAPTPSPPPNREPIVANPVPILRGIGGHAFSYEFTQGGTTFLDPDGDLLAYDVWLFPRAGPELDTLTVVGTTITGVLPGAGWIEVNVYARDGRGPSTPHQITIVIDPNSPPVVASANSAVMTTPGAHINYDPAQGGKTFTDPDGDFLTYEVRVLSDSKGLSIAGGNVAGALYDVGAVNFEITAHDDYGGSTSDRFAIAIAAPEPGEPSLGQSFVYADEEVPLPLRFRSSSGSEFGPFWNVTPRDNLITNAGATLGRVLFYDKRLSITNTLACGSCHHQENGFAGGNRFDSGVQGVPLTRNTMALTNVRYNFSERWFSDMRAQTIEDLIRMPIEEPSELGNFLPSLEAKLAATPFYLPLFEAAFGTPEITADRIARALAQFLRSMISYRTKFDAAYIDGFEPVPGVLTAEELRGEQIFKGNPGALCSMCHIQEIQTLAHAANTGLDAVVTDPGAGGGAFRTASLRNIAVTGPYMHDGRFATLREVIDHYDHGVQASLTLSDLLQDRDGAPKRLALSEEDKDALEAFLHTLTDDEFVSDPKYADPFL